MNDALHDAKSNSIGALLAYIAAVEERLLSPQENELLSAALMLGANGQRVLREKPLTVMAETISYESAASPRLASISMVVWLLALAGAISVGVGLVEGTKAVNAIRAMQWPVAQGTIVSSEICRETLLTDVGGKGRVTRTTASRFYATYADAVNGVRYTGSRFDALTRGVALLRGAHGEISRRRLAGDERAD